ncbi:MAG: hypothetical protein ABIH63_04350 [archaeon]
MVKKYDYQITELRFDKNSPELLKVEKAAESLGLKLSAFCKMSSLKEAQEVLRKNQE